jgi:hypothetical protein
MEIAGLILIILIVIGAGTGISALISSFYMQKRVLELYQVVFNLAQEVERMSRNVSEEKE